MTKVKVVERSVKAAKKHLEILGIQADKLVTHKHVQAAARSHSSMHKTLGLARLEVEEVNL
jgi:hypothetical protein